MVQSTESCKNDGCESQHHHLSQPAAPGNQSISRKTSWWPTSYRRSKKWSLYGKSSSPQSFCNASQLKNVFFCVYVSDRFSRKSPWLGLRSRLPAWSSALCVLPFPVHDRIRLSWAWGHVGWTKQEGREVLLIDESTFLTNNEDRRVRVWEEERFLNVC